LSLGTASSTAVVIGKTGTPVTIPGNVAINGALTLGSASTTGQLLFHIASSSFTTLLQASSSQASNLTFSLPTTAGTAGQAMLTDGAGNFFFGNPSLSQWLNGTSGTISYSSGSIGINTTTPTSLFSIVGSSTSPASLFNIASSSGASLFSVSGNGNVTVGNKFFTTGNGVGYSLGGNIASGDDAAILIHRAATNPLSAGGSHAMRDESTYVASGTGGYASFDSIPVMSGSLAYNHMTSFQARPQFAGSLSIDALRGFTFMPLMSSGTVTNVQGLYIQDTTGAGTVTNQYGIYMDLLAKGSNNYAIYTNGATPSYFGGSVQTGGDAIIGGSKIKLGAFPGDWGTDYPLGVYKPALAKGNFALVDTTTAGAGVGGGIILGGAYGGTANYADWAFVKSGKLNATGGDYAGYLSFGTRANGAATAEAMRLNPDKSATINGGGAASTGVCWMADAKTLGHCTTAWSGTPPTCTCSQ
jgi:hypothetical protein